MNVPGNLVVGTVGALLALYTGGYMAVNWEELVGLETWEASFETEQVRLPDRSSGMASGSTLTEVYEIPHANLTRLQVDLTWTDPAFNSPEVTLRLLDPSRKVRLEESHTGGGSGIHLVLQTIPSEEIPGNITTFRARSDPQDAHAQNEFNTRWPSREESVGTWTFEIRTSPAEGPAPGGNIAYYLRTQYEYYQGSFAQVPTGTR